MNKDYLILKNTLKGVKGICSCGYEQEFKYDHSDIDFDDKLEGLKLQKEFVCPECNSTYIRIKRDETEKKKSDKSFTLFAIIFGIALILIIPFGLLLDDSEPTFYDTGDPNNMTEKELQDYNEWLEEKNEKDADNRKIYD